MIVGFLNERCIVDETIIESNSNLDCQQYFFDRATSTVLVTIERDPPRPVVIFIEGMGLNAAEQSRAALQ